jgi:tyrosyl-tRNA synthetase
MLTFLPLEQINEMDSWKDAKINEAKEILAYELTKLVHGEEEAEKAKAAAKALFVSGGDDANMPTTEVSADKLTDGKIGFLNLMVLCGLAPSNKQARQLVQQGGVLVNDEKMDDPTFSVTEDMLREGVKIRKGKKVFHKAVLA